jgi:hypothetical protein
LVGSQVVFGIESEITGLSKGWILGHFRFWIRGSELGDWADSVDLKGCSGWLRDFAQHPRNRFEPALASVSKEEIFSLLYDPEIHPTSDQTPALFDDAYSRFHIKHLGMSSFDRFNVLLLDDHSEQRCVWRDRGDMVVREALFRSGTMERVAEQFVAWFESTPEFREAGHLPKS